MKNVILFPLIIPTKYSPMGRAAFFILIITYRHNKFANLHCESEKNCFFWLIVYIRNMLVSSFYRCRLHSSVIETQILHQKLESRPKLRRFPWEAGKRRKSLTDNADCTGKYGKKSQMWKNLIWKTSVRLSACLLYIYMEMTEAKVWLSK